MVEILHPNQQSYSRAWGNHDTESRVYTETDIKAAMDIVMRIKQKEDSISVLITGSFNIVGHAIQILSP
jgi:folylpolyglutamate synthase/dihydropteroate synthase